MFGGTCDTSSTLRAFPADCPHLADCHCRLTTTSTGGFSEFPAYSQVYLRNYNIDPGTLCIGVAISIVTAAVYRGFDQELRLAADPIN
jgi:hypothetical protein